MGSGTLWLLMYSSIRGSCFGWDGVILVGSGSCNLKLLGRGRGYSSRWSWGGLWNVTMQGVFFWHLSRFLCFVDRRGGREYMVSVRS